MLTMDPALVAHFAAGKPYAEETYVWIIGRNAGTGAEEPFGLWTGEHTLSFTVFDPRVQANVLRSYVGSGSIEVVPIIMGSPNLQTQNAITFEFSTVVSGVRDLFRGKNLRASHVQVHKGYFDTATDKLIANPMLVYVGMVDEGSEDEPAQNADGSASDPARIGVSFIPHIRSFKKNSKTRSFATGQGRSGDIFYKWSNVVAAWRIWWGRNSKGHSESSSVRVSKPSVGGLKPDSGGSTGSCR
jgi:hypothetical protein